MAATTNPAGPARTTGARARGEGFYAKAVRRFLRHRLGRLGVVVLLLLALTALLAPVIAPYSPIALDLPAALQPPSLAHPFGTDELGRDILSRIVHGSRISLVIVAVALAVSVTIGTLIGLLSGYAGGLVDDVVMRIMDGLMTFPGLVLALAIVAVLGPNLLNAIAALAIVGIPAFARLARGEVLSVRGMEFVEAARALGASDARIVGRHVWPSITGVVVVNASLRASQIILAESSLSFLGLGAQPPTPTWGSMVAGGIQYWNQAWWMSFFPGLAIFVTVLAMNFFGDALRDALDTRTSG